MNRTLDKVNDFSNGVFVRRVACSSTHCRLVRAVARGKITLSSFMSAPIDEFRESNARIGVLEFIETISTRDLACIKNNIIFIGDMMS